jgi:hypothetical protein
LQHALDEKKANCCRRTKHYINPYTRTESLIDDIVVLRHPGLFVVVVVVVVVFTRQKWAPSAVFVCPLYGKSREAKMGMPR